MPRKSRATARRAAWLAFGLVVLATAVSTQDAQSQLTSITSDVLSTSATSHAAPIETTASELSPPPEDNAAEANRAYKSAIATLQGLASHPSSQFTSSSTPSLSSTLLAHYLPGQGPISSFLRMTLRLHHHVQQSLNSLASTLGLSAATRHPPGRGRRASQIDSEEDLRLKSIKILDLLQHAIDLGHDDAIYTLARVHLLPPTPYFDFSPQTAIPLLHKHVERTGSADSHALLAFFYASGYRPLIKGSTREPVVETSQSLALLHYTFAAHAGHKGAQMALGYRYWSGIGVVDDCFRALEWYSSAAGEAMGKFLSGPPGGLTLPQTPTRLSDLEGGVYGPGASAASTGINNQRPAIKAGLARSAGETWEDVLEYYIFNAERGEMDFAYRLGRVFYQGSIYASAGGIASGSEGVGQVKRDFPRARYYFLKIARGVWPKDPPNPGAWTPPRPAEDAEKTRPKGVAYASSAAGYLGRMYLRGEGVKRDYALAKLWFERGAEYGDRESLNGLGIIWRDGLVGPPAKASNVVGAGKVDLVQALKYFSAAASQDLAEAHVNMGKHYYENGDLPLARAHFEAGVRSGSPFEAYYYLGSMYAAQATTTSQEVNEHLKAGSCSMAVSFYKLVAERGVWDDDLLKEAETGWVTSDRGAEVGVGWITDPVSSDQSKEVALLKWWIAAERGHEIAQNNLAWILDQDRSMFRLTRFSPITPSNVTAQLALNQWTRAAAQHNIDALVKVADYYYHGLGLPDSNPDSEDIQAKNARLEKATKYYQNAADTQMSAIAMWSLGWMYENGIGVPQDFHLAKRNYDSALETNSEAYLPVMLSLGKLYVRSIWHTLTGGTGGLSIWFDEDEDTDFTRKKPENSDGGQIGGAKERDASDSEQSQEDELEDEDDYWYIGRAKDDFNRRLSGRGARRDDDDDPVQYARDHRRAESDREDDFGPEDDFEGALRGARRRDLAEDDEQEDEFEETMLLLFLCLAVSALLYIRTRLMQRMRNEHQPPPQQ